jgi:hypothetical protein
MSRSPAANERGAMRRDLGAADTPPGKYTVDVLRFWRAGYFALFVA